MEKTTFACECGHRLTVPAAHAGRKGQCPKCKATVRVPGAGLKKLAMDVKGKNIARVELSVAPTLPSVATEFFTGWLRSYVPQAAFKDGQTLQLGWFLLSCRVSGDRLTLLAPDLRAMPIRYSEDLSPALMALLEHKYVPESFGLEPDIPRLQQSATITAEFDELPCVMVRETSLDAHDSGWVFNSIRPGADNNDPDRLGRMSLYEAVLKAPRLLRYLSLPRGAEVVFRRGAAPEVRVARRAVQPAKGSYVAEKLKAEAAGSN